MPIREDLLTPIAGDNPSGTYLYYSPIYDKIKEARREDDDLGPSGVWAREKKVADWSQVIRLAGEALATQTKDLQIAAWLTEAYLKKEGFASFRESLDMLRALLEQFWDTLYPEIEDGDSEFRATPLSWIGNFDLQIRLTGITKGGKTAVDYKTAQGVGYKATVENDYEAKQAFDAKIAEGKLSLDDWDVEFSKTSKQYYVALEGNMAGCLESLESLQAVCEAKFGDYAPGFSKLRTALEETRNTVRILLMKKRELEPDPVEQSADAEPEETPVEEFNPVPAAEAPVQQPVKKKAGALSAEPQDMDDAVARLQVVAKYVRSQDAYSPAPYLLLAGFRFGELRASGDTIDQSKLDAPPTELRQQIKKFAMESQWQEVLNSAEQAIGLPCGRGWLDAHRYAARACSELGWYYEALRKGIISTVRGVLSDYPDLTKLTLMDDTPTANAETVQWIESDVIVAQQTSPQQEESYAMPPISSPSSSHDGDEAAPPDAWDLAQQALRGGRVREAVELIDREAKMEQSGRGRFLRKTQLARIFIDSGNEPMAMPILEQLAAEIDSKGLENWEQSDTIAHPLSLLYRCLARSNKDGEETKKLYAKLCRLDPVAAMNVLR